MGFSNLTFQYLKFHRSTNSMGQAMEHPEKAYCVSDAVHVKRDSCILCLSSLSGIELCEDNSM